MVPVALYVPWVQRMVVGQTLNVLNDNDQNMRYSIGNLQLRFPLAVELWDVCLYRPSTNDTLVYVHHLRTALDDWPHGEQPDFVVRELLIEQVRTGIDSALVAGLDLRGGLGQLRVEDVALCLDSNRVGVGRVWLDAPQFNVAYGAADTLDPEPIDTTQSAPWQVRLGQLGIADLSVHYDQWRIDSLYLQLSQFAMMGDDLRLDTLDLRLPRSAIGASAAVRLADSSYQSIQAHLDLYVSRADLLHVAGEAMPELERYLPDSACLLSRMSLYMTPDTMEAAPFSLSLPGYIGINGTASAVYPFDQVRRRADVALTARLDHTDTLLTVLMGDAEQRGFQVPDHLELHCTASQRGETADALLTLLQDSVPRLTATATCQLATEAYRASLSLSRLRVADFVPSVDARDLSLTLDVDGQHYDIADSSTLLQARLAIDTVSYRQVTDSSQLNASLHDVLVSGHLHADTVQAQAGINFSIDGIGSFDSLMIDFLNSRSQMALHVGVGDAQIDADAACDLYQLSDVLDHVMAQLDMQTTSKAFDINELQRTRPDLAITAGMRRDNPIVPLLEQQGVGFDRLHLSLTNTDSLRMSLGIDSLRYDQVQIARVGASLVPYAGNYDYRADVLYEDTVTDRDFQLSARARLLSDSILVQGRLVADTIPVLTFDGCLSHRLHADVWLASLPLTLANGFLSDDLRLAGTLEGHAQMDCDSVDFNALRAAVWFDSASVWYEGCDMTVGLPQDSIVYHEGQLTLDHIRFMTSNGNPLQIDGTVDMRRHPDNPDIDLMITADEAQLFSNRRRRSRGQFIYGTLPLSASVAVVGSVNDLSVQGTVSVPKGCDLTYFYEDDGSVSSNSQLNDLVEFVSFAEIDSTIVVMRESGTMPRRPQQQESNLDVNLKLRIDPTTRVTAWLPTSKDDHVMIRGGGDLKVTLAENGSLQLSGGYNVSDGDINFKLPMLPVTKEFALTNESWLRWSGIVDQPELNFKATEDVKCTINDAVAGARVVKFVVSILIRGTLEDMDILFDCSAPDDAAIQSELASLTDEERTKQALMLLVAQTYTGPSATGSSAGLSSANAAMSSLINKQLESMLSGRMKHTEINVGIDTYDPNGTGAQQTDYSLSVSQRFFNDRMRVTVGGKMSTGDEVQQSDGAVLSDVSLEWLIRPDASQYARLFRHINYQSILEGQVVESGIGYVQRREAFKFKHLFIRSRRKLEQTRREMLRQLQMQQAEQTRDELRRAKGTSTIEQKNNETTIEPQ